MIPSLTIRPEATSDEAAVRRVNEGAFAGSVEANLVDALRLACPETVSLVAITGTKLIGHVLFTSARIDVASGSVAGMGLAPMAVLPAHRHGVSCAYDGVPPEAFMLLVLDRPRMAGVAGPSSQPPCDRSEKSLSTFARGNIIA